MGKFVVFDGAMDDRRHCGEFGVGEVNCRHGANTSKERGAGSRYPQRAEPKLAQMPEPELLKNMSPAPWETGAGQARLPQLSRRRMTMLPLQNGDARGQA